MAVIGIDVGTSGVRACLLNADGRTLAHAERPLPAGAMNAQGRHEQNPQHWLTACGDVIRELIASGHPITDLAIAGTSGTLVLGDCDANEAWMYDDRRAGHMAQRIAALAPAGHPAASSGASLPRALLARELGFKGPLQHPAEWLAGCMGANPHCDENNALKLGYDPVSRRWPDWAAGLPDAPRPDILRPGQPAGTVSKRFAGQTGLPDNCVIRAGTTDSTAACLATGPLSPGTGITVLGSTLVLKIVSSQPVFDSASGIYSHRIGDVWLVGGASNSGGRVLKQFFTEQQLIELSARIDTGHSSGLDYYPLPATGERFPINDPALESRLTPRPDDPVTFLHGLLEGIARIEHMGYQKLHQLGTEQPARVISIGGGARNPSWTTIRQRLLNCDMVMADSQEVCAGAARLCLPASRP